MALDCLIQRLPLQTSGLNMENTELNEYKSSPEVVNLYEQIKNLSEQANQPNTSPEIRKEILLKVLDLSLSLAKAAKK